MSVKISRLPNATLPLSGSELVPIVQNDTTVKAPAGAFVIYPETDAESAAGVTIVNYNYLPGDIRRYGNNTTPGTTDCTTQVRNWLAVGGRLTGYAEVFIVTGQCEIVEDNTHVDARGMTLQHETSTAEAVIYAEGRTNVSWVGGSVNGRKALKSGPGVVQAYGFHFVGCDRSGIEGAYVYDCFEHGIRFGMDEDDDTPSSDCYVRGCYSYNNGQASTGRGWGIWGFSRIDGLEITDNFVIGNYAGGIFVDDTSSGATPGLDGLRIIISGNIVEAPADVSASSVPGSAIGISGCRQVLISNNLGEGYAYGVSATAAQANTLTKVNVRNNQFSGSQYAARFVDIEDSTIQGNTFVITDETDNSRVGIELYSNPQAGGTNVLRNVAILGNTIRSARVGIRHGINAAHSTTSSGLLIEGNDILYIGSTSASGSNLRRGIRLDDVTDAIVKGNTIRAFNYGVYWDADTEARASDNTVEDCVTAAFRVPSALDNLLAHNETRGNGTGVVIEAAANVVTTILRNNTFSDGISGGSDVTSEDNNGIAGTTRTAAAIASIANAINTTGKYAGKLVWDSTNTRMMRASGSAAGSTWISLADPGTVVTPV